MLNGKVCTKASYVRSKLHVLMAVRSGTRVRLPVDALPKLAVLMTGVARAQILERLSEMPLRKSVSYSVDGMMSLQISCWCIQRLVSKNMTSQTVGSSDDVPFQGASLSLLLE